MVGFNSGYIGSLAFVLYAYCPALCVLCIMMIGGGWFVADAVRAIPPFYIHLSHRTTRRVATGEPEIAGDESG